MSTSIRQSVAFSIGIAAFLFGVAGVDVLSRLAPTESVKPAISTEDKYVVPKDTAASDDHRELKETETSSYGDRSKWKLIRRHLDGQFSIEIPQKFREPDRPADVDGGFFLDDTMSINYNYWKFANTPFCMRDSLGRYSKRPNLVCSRYGIGTRTFRTVLNNRAAFIQECRFEDPSDNFSYLYYATFPHTMVRDDDVWGKGVFNIEISYNDPKLREVAERIIKSLRFDRK